MNNHFSDSAQNFDLTGKTVGDYYLIRRLGRGGMADVYLARQNSLKRNVALKILKPELANDASYVQRFRLEAQAAAALVQANIVQIYEVNEAEGLHFIAQEYIPGRNLKQYINRYGAVEPLMAINVLRQVGLALQKSSEMKVIHRDIKPENIMISTTGEVKVADFGLARVNDDKSKQDLTQIGITMGTPLYMSPEQIGGEDLDARSDIYSLGVTAYHMLAGHPPYEGDTALAIALQHVNDEPKSLSDLRPDMPPELCQLIHKMMAKKVEDRPADAAEVLKELRKVNFDAEQDWEQLVEKLATTDSLSDTKDSLESRLAATQQLESVMRGNTQSWWRTPMTLTLLSGLLALGIGIGVGNSLRNTKNDLLEVDLIPRQETVREQYRQVYLENDYFNLEEHWQAVIDYFPIDEAEVPNLTKYYHRRAQERLGELYIIRSEWTKALDIYEDFIDIEGVNKEFNLIGWAGKAIVYQGLIDSGDPDLISMSPEKMEMRIRHALSKVSELTTDQIRLNQFMQKRIRLLARDYTTDSAYIGSFSLMVHDTNR